MILKYMFDRLASLVGLFCLWPVLVVVDDSSAPRVPFIALSEYRRFTLRDFS